MCVTLLLRAVSTLCVILLMSGTSGQREGSSDFAYVKLKQDNSSDQLALSYKENGSWLPVCGDTWTEANSAVVCRQLGMRYIEYSTVPANFVKFSSYSWYCYGMEEDISHCYRVSTSSTCNYRYFVVLTCKDERPAPAGSVLTTDYLQAGGKDSDLHGFLLITEYNNIKWTICAEDHYNKMHLVRMLSVACTQLGFKSLGTFELVSRAILPSRYKDVKCLPSTWICSGNEENLVDCEWSRGVSVTWRLYVECSTSGIPEDGDVRLVGGNNLSGFIEVFYNSTWGRFCHYSDCHTVQKIVCRQLHLGPPVDKHFTYSHRHYGWVHDICFGCLGQESKLSECKEYDNLLPCPLQQLLYVSCLPPVKTLSIHLVYGELKNPLGKVQIQLSNESSNVIGGPNWGLKESMVMCHMLNHGLPVPPLQYESRLFTSSKQSLKIKPACKGHEGSLLECDTRISQGEITTDEVVFLQCAQSSNVKECEVILVDVSLDSEEKFVFLFYDDRWRPLCGDSYVWNRNRAQTVCKHQGFAMGVPHSSSETFMGMYGMPVIPECPGFQGKPSEYEISRGRRQPCSKMATVFCGSMNTRFGEPSSDARGVWIFVSVALSSLLIVVMIAALVWFSKRTLIITNIRSPSTPSISEDSPATFALSSSSVKYSSDPPPSYNEFTANPQNYPIPSVENGHALTEEPPAYPGCSKSVDHSDPENECTYV